MRRDVESEASLSVLYFFAANLQRGRCTFAITQEDVLVKHKFVQIFGAQWNVDQDANGECGLGNRKRPKAWVLIPLHLAPEHVWQPKRWTPAFAGVSGVWGKCGPRSLRLAHPTRSLRAYRPALPITSISSAILRR